MRLSALRVGDGPRGIVLLHGYLGSGRNLWSLARAWSREDALVRLLLLDLTGHGTSPPLRPETTLGSVAADVLETAAEEGLVPPWRIVGHSLGGRVALAALDQDPTRVGRVDLLDISPGPVGSAGNTHTVVAEAFARVPAWFAAREQARSALAAEGLPRPMVDWLLTNLIPQDGGFGWRVDRQALLDLRPAHNAVDLWGVVERFGPRVRCIRGARSPYVPDEDVARMEQLGCRVQTIADAGHFLHVDKLPELLAALRSE
jgi:pimeloyl-ACP methyl ester carboxylesterase